MTTNQFNPSSALGGTGFPSFNPARAGARGRVLAALGWASPSECGAAVPLVNRPAAAWSSLRSVFRPAFEKRGPRGGFDVVPPVADCVSDRVARGRVWARALVARSISLLALGGAVSAGLVLLCLVSPAAVRADLREGWARAAASERAEVGVELRRIRAARLLAAGDGVPMGTDSAKYRRGWSVVGALPPVEFVPSATPGRGERLLSSSLVGGGEFAFDVKTRRKMLVLGAHGRGADVGPLGVRKAAFAGGRAWVFGLACERAERQAARFCRRSIYKAAAGRHEAGGAAGADDVGAFHEAVRLEIAAILRGEAVLVLSRFYNEAARLGVRVNRSARRAALELAAASARGKSSGRDGIAARSPRADCFRALRAAGVRVNRHHRRALSLVVDRIEFVPSRPPGKQGAGRSAVRAWQYGATRGRDGREVPGGWALQGSLHGLRDFSLSSVDDFGAACVSDDSESVPLPEIASGRDRSAELVAAGYSDKLAAILAADSSGPGEDLGGVLCSRPDSGAGSGVRPSVLNDLRAWSDGVRAGFAAHVAAASKGQAAAKARAAQADSLALVEGLLSFAAGGPSVLSPDDVAAFLDVSGALSEKGRKRLSRIRQRAGLPAPVRAGKPLEAVQFAQAIAARFPE